MPGDWNPKVEQRVHPFGEKGVVSSLEEVADRVAKGGVSPRVRLWAIECLDRARAEQSLQVNTEKERAEILLRAVQKKLWVPDPVGTEWMAGAHLMACDPSKDGVCFRGGDCFAEGALLLAEGHELIPVEKVKPGVKIWGLNRWSTVEATAYKGLLPVDVITLNNGSELKLTPGHHVYVLDCQNHPMLNDSDGPIALPPDRHWRGGSDRWGCSCGADGRIEKRIRVCELREGMVMPAPDRIPFGAESMDPDRAHIEGLYVADGWCEDYRFSISGQDGAPKEEQKREVKAACERLGVSTSWQRKHIRINDSEWSLRIQQMGCYAPEKHLLSINLDEGAAGPTLRGVMADSGKNTRGGSRTFTTTSRELAVQTRVLHKMFGISCGWRYIEDHGGLGRNPIYRLGTREQKNWMLRVRSVEREVLSVPCWDIQTDDHRIYLPEHDVTVANCDDLVVLLGSCFCSVGIYTLVVGHAYNKHRDISHVLTSARVNGRWMYADPSTKLPLGECVQFTRERIYSVPNIKMLCDDNVCLANPRRYDPERAGFVAKGEFVGVEGVPSFTWLAPKQHVEWVGEYSSLGVAHLSESVDCAELTDETARKLCQFAKDRNFGTSESDIDGYVEAGAGMAAGAACAAAGCPACAPFCAALGSQVAKAVWGSLKSTFGDITKNLGGGGARQFADRIAAEQKRVFQVMGEYQGALNYALGSTATILVAAHDEVMPQRKGLWAFRDAITQMGIFGLPLVFSYPEIPGIGSGWLTAPVRGAISGAWLAPDYYGDLYRYADFLSGDALAKKSKMDMVGRARIIESMLPALRSYSERKVVEGSQWVERLQLAGGLTGGLIASNATELRLESELPKQLTGGSPIFKAQQTKKKKKKKKSKVPALVGAAAAGALAWWLWP